MNYVLGLVLSLTDDASAGINRAADSLNQFTKIAENASKSINDIALSDFARMAERVGRAFTKTGAGIISTFSGIISKVNETGITLMYAENQLNSLYEGSGKTGAEVIAQIQKYAKESMFDFENLIPAVTSLKSVGIEAFDSITSSTGNAKYSLLDYASALASFAPQMRNAYGTGINAAIGAMREYIAEGNKMSLKRGAGLDITQIIGEEKGSTIEERTRQVADLIEQLGMLGMVDMMKDSPQVKLSNMGDVLFQLKGMISDADIGGLSTKMNDFINVFYDFVTGISDERLETIARNIGSALSSLMDPVMWLSEKLVKLADSFVRLMETNPKIAKFITTGGALVGVLLTLSGVFLLFTAMLAGVTRLMTKCQGVFSLFVSTFKVNAIKMMSTILPLVAKIGLLYLAWKNDLFGIRTNVTRFAEHLVSSFKTARQAVNGNVEDLISTLEDLRGRGDFFSNLTIGIMKVMGLFKVLEDAWADNTISEELYQKMQALGIEPLVNAILDLKYRVENFVKGFKFGMQQIAEGFTTAFEYIESKAKGTFLETILQGLTDFFKLLSSGDAQAWYDFGQSFAWLVTAIATVAVVVKTLGFLSSVIIKVASAFKFLWGVVSTVGSVISSVFSFLINSVFGNIVMIVGGIVLAVSNFFSMLSSGFSWVKEILMIVGIALAAIGAIILGAPAFIAGVIAGIVAVIATLVVVIKDNWAKIKEVFVNIGEGISVFFKTLVNTVLFIIGGMINGIIGGINSAIGLLNKIPGVNIPVIGELSIPQLAKGGIIDSPTLSMIGEAGTEAVMPLENNTGWIDTLASKISSQMRSSQSSYLTRGSTSPNTVGGNTDNSVVFNQGSIQITVQNATEEEAVNLAKKIMEYIKRQRELDSMLSYA